MPNDTPVTIQSGPQPADVDLGTCDFVEHWCKKIEGKPTVSADEIEICGVCHSLFSSDSLLLSQIKVGALDKQEQTILQVYFSGEAYKIYRTRQGVSVHFADCRRREQKQREKYLNVLGKLYRLRFLASQMGRWPYVLRWLNKSGGFYDHQIAEAMCLALEGNAPEADQIIDDGLALAANRLTNENRIRYLAACLAVALVPAALVAWLYLFHLAPHPEWFSVLLAGATGAIGAAFSITMRVQSLNLHPCEHSVMNYIMGSLRVLTGFTAGILLLLLITHTVLGKAIQALFEPESTVDWQNISLVGFLGGFAERLVPSLLATFESRAEGAIIEDHGSSTSKGPPVSPVPAAAPTSGYNT
jgi:hypothetical protein